MEIKTEVEHIEETLLIMELIKQNIELSNDIKNVEEILERFVNQNKSYDKNGTVIYSTSPFYSILLTTIKSVSDKDEIVKMLDSMIR